MKRIQFLISDEKAEKLEQLIKRTGLSTKTDLINTALTLFEWAVRERESGRIITSLDEQTERYKEIELPGFPSTENDWQRKRMQSNELQAKINELVERMKTESKATINYPLISLLKSVDKEEEVVHLEEHTD